ncbi:STAS domain-containing protein [Paenibacillus paridis]|uniref:STAS domain-containing protein n=1 Tax=Paenibacillus paridis TaxID=2583376 RepID=UPI00111F07E4|nr:STAS domain-containing protein [Paenibacillus paridis]
MLINVEQQNEISIISLSGRLDGASMGEVEQRFLELLGQGMKQFVFDMNELEYISSAGLRVMLLAVKKTRAIAGKIALCNLNANVQEVFQISGFSTIFEIFPEREEALQFFRA